MSIIHNLSEISSITVGSENIENIYLGEDLLWTAESCPYTPDQVIFEQATAGTYSLDILADGKYEVYCIGGGAGGAAFAGKKKMGSVTMGYASCSSGGSGAGFIGIIEISKNNYSITVGSGGNKGTKTDSYNVDGKATAGGGENSSIDSLVIAYGGSSHDSNTAGTGGNTPIISTPIISETLNLKGNNGTNNVTGSYGKVSCNTTASIYNNHGSGGNASATSGASLSASASNGEPGYVKIVYKGK